MNKKYTEKELAEIYNKVANCGEEYIPPSTTKAKYKFRKVYKAPGYPITPGHKRRFIKIPVESLNNERN